MQETGLRHTRATFKTSTVWPEHYVGGGESEQMEGKGKQSGETQSDAFTLDYMSPDGLSGEF